VYQTGTINLIPASANPRISINGQIADSIKVNNETGAFKMRLTNGKSYKLQVVAVNYDSQPSILDLGQSTEFKTMHHNIYAEPKKAAKLIVSGIVLDKKTGKSLDPSIPVQIIVNGMTANANYYNTTGEYTLELSPSVDYTLNASVSGYYPVYETVVKSESPQNIYLKRDLIITPIEVGQSVKINNIFFETGKANLQPASFSELNRVIKFLSENPSIKIEIEGHTDNVGNAVKNTALSKARAKSVAGYITDNGIEVTRVSSVGYGSAKPVGENKTPKGKAANRRVEFKILGK
jgi:outer membrane protein OmpA-like peptidoglycan-associated protein